MLLLYLLICFFSLAGAQARVNPGMAVLNSTILESTPGMIVRTILVSTPTVIVATPGMMA
jgi:hypothetical protein